MNNLPLSCMKIGVFDSGLGGLSVVRELHRMLPYEDIVYYGDSANAPYGVRNVEEVKDLSESIVKTLIEKDVKAIVIACNTATSAAAQYLRERYSIPIIGMEPALKLACERVKEPLDGEDMPVKSPFSESSIFAQTHSPSEPTLTSESQRKKILVAATSLTLHEKKFTALRLRFNEDYIIDTLACPQLVTLVENDELDDHDKVLQAFHKLFDILNPSSYDAVVLGCTHFVFYKNYFKQFFDPHTAIIDGNEGTIRHLEHVLYEKNALCPPTENKKGTITLFNSKEDTQTFTLMEKLTYEALPS